MPRSELIGGVTLPVVVVLGGISATRHVASHPADQRPGWWDPLVGRGRAVDLERFRVLGVDWEAGPRAGTAEQAEALACALDDAGIDAVHAIVGASFGGMVALAFGARFPQRAGRLVLISAAHETHPMATAVRAIQRRIVRLGVAHGCEGDALALARALAMTTYRTAEEFAGRFENQPGPAPEGVRFPVEDYLDACGERFAAGFSSARYLALSEAIDLHRVEPEAVQVPAHLLAISSDTLVPVWQMRSLHLRLGAPAALTELESAFGHDAFLKEVEGVSRFVARALKNGAVP